MRNRIRVRMTLEEQQGTGFRPLKTVDIACFVQFESGVWRLCEEQRQLLRQGIRGLLRELAARESATRLKHSSPTRVVQNPQAPVPAK